MEANLHFEISRDPCDWISGDCAKSVLSCIWGGVRNHLGFQSQVKDFDCYSKNNEKCFKGFQQDIHTIKFGF